MMRKVILLICAAFCFPAFGSQTEQALAKDPPKDIPIPNIIESFAAKEQEFKEAFQHYSHTENVVVKADCPNQHTGYYRRAVDVRFDNTGKRTETEKGLNSTLDCIFISGEDLDSFRSPSLLLLTTDDIQKYQINFIGQQKQDKGTFYIFDVSPVNVLKGKKYFQGRIWVDGHDLMIVKTQGTIVTGQKKKTKESEDLSPGPWTTWRAQVDGRYWFPLYSQVSGVLHFSGANVGIEETIKLTDFKALGRTK